MVHPKIYYNCVISGTIKDAGTNTASDKAFVAGDVIGAGGSGSTKTVAVA